MEQGPYGLKMSLYTDLQDSEISIIKENDQLIHAEFQFEKQLDLFSGHFPGNPILPGIFQIEMVKYAVEKALDTGGLFINSVKKTKFSSLIHPGKTVMLDITVNREEKNRFKVKGVLKVNDTIAGKVNLNLTKK